MPARSPKKIELLAPARNLETGIAAINCGADAVYIGAEQFGARAAAGNTVADIEALAAYAHRYRARVYVALNTILRDEEFSRARALIEQLYRAGIDALIIQDTGLLECDLPPLPLFASTQMDNCTVEQVGFLEQVGFQRAILARELGLDEIRAIRRATTIELECFVHGALCVGRSGRCYLSYAIGGRSGNRGVCAQPCRLPYSLLDAEDRIIERERHLLSLKDLNRSAHLKALMRVGVTSFKIEGRLKDTGYVMNIVAFYRREIDRLLEGSAYVRASSGTSIAGFTPDPAQSFNRGFTDFFIGPESRIASLDSPKSRGKKIGRATLCRKDSFVLDSDTELLPGDGICFNDKSGALSGTRIMSVAEGRVYPEHMHGLAADTVVYRNFERAFQRSLKQAQPCRTIAVRCVLEETEDGFRLSAQDEDGVTARADLTAPKSPADQPEQALQTLRRQLAKFGGTEFNCTGLEVHSGPWFIPVSALNRLRRDLVENLRLQREHLRSRQQRTVAKNTYPCFSKRLDPEANVLNSRARAFYHRHGVHDIAPAIESAPVPPGTIIMRSRYCLRRELGLCKDALRKAGFQEPLRLVDPEGNAFRLVFDCAQCEMRLEWQGREKKRPSSKKPKKS